MKAKAKVSKENIAVQHPTTKEVTAKADSLVSQLSEILERLESVRNKVQGLLCPLLLVADTLINNSSGGLDLETEDAQRVEYGSVSMASGEVLEILASRLYASGNQLDALSGDLRRTLENHAKHENASMADSAA